MYPSVVGHLKTDFWSLHLAARFRVQFFQERWVSCVVYSYVSKWTVFNVPERHVLKNRLFFNSPCCKVLRSFFLNQTFCQFTLLPALVSIFMFSHVAIWPGVVTLQILGNPMYPSAMSSGWRHETFLSFGYWLTTLVFIFVFSHVSMNTQICYSPDFGYTNVLERHVPRVTSRYMSFVSFSLYSYNYIFF